MSAKKKPASPHHALSRELADRRMADVIRKSWDAAQRLDEALEALSRINGGVSTHDVGRKAVARLFAFRLKLKWLDDKLLRAGGATVDGLLINEELKRRAAAQPATPATGEQP